MSFPTNFDKWFNLLNSEKQQIFSDRQDTSKH